MANKCFIYNSFMKYILIFLGEGVWMGKGKSLWKRAVFKAVEALPVVSEPLFLALKVIKYQTSTDFIHKHINFNAFLPFSFFFLVTKYTKWMVVKFNTYVSTVAWKWLALMSASKSDEFFSKTILQVRVFLKPGTVTFSWWRGSTGRSVLCFCRQL